MKVKTYDNTEEWLADRGGRITGTKLKDITPKKYGKNKRKIGFYKLAAHYLGVDDDSVDGIDRGHELEQEGVLALGKELGIDFKTDLVLWESDEDSNISYSPDGFTEDFTITAELKHLGTARHLEVIDTNEIPDEYWLQVVQSFIVNEKQQDHYFASRDPRVTSRPIHWIRTTRLAVADEIELYGAIEHQTLLEVREFVERIAF